MKIELKRLIDVLFVLFLFGALLRPSVAQDDYRLDRSVPGFAGYTLSYPVFGGTYNQASLTTTTVATIASDLSSATVQYNITSTDTLTVSEVWIQTSVDSRWTLDNNTNPTSVTGILLSADDTLKLPGNSARWLRIIGVSSSGYIRKQYFGWPTSYYYPWE